MSRGWCSLQITAPPPETLSGAVAAFPSAVQIRAGSCRGCALMEDMTEAHPEQLMGLRERAAMQTQQADGAAAQDRVRC